MSANLPSEEAEEDEFHSARGYAERWGEGDDEDLKPKALAKEEVQGDPEEWEDLEEEEKKHEAEEHSVMHPRQ